MEEYQTPYDVYQAKGYSAKQTFTTIFSGALGVGLVIIAGIVVIKFMSALDKETLRTFAMLFFGIVLTGLALAISVGLAVVYRFIQKPGVQMPGILGRIERKLEGK